MVSYLLTLINTGRGLVISQCISRQSICLPALKEAGKVICFITVSFHLSIKHLIITYPTLPSPPKKKKGEARKYLELLFLNKYFGCLELIP